MKKVIVLATILLASVLTLSAEHNENGTESAVKSSNVEVNALPVLQNYSTSGSVSTNHRSNKNGSLSTVSGNSKYTGKARKGTWEFGGSLGLSFGDYTNINISPQIGYRFNQYFSLGGGVSYNYYDDKDYDYSLNYLGFNMYMRIYPVRYFMIFGQPEIHRRWGSIHGEDNKSEVFSCMLVGAGAIIPMGARSGMTISVHYDVSQNKYSPYGDNIGYSIGYTYNF